MSTPSSSHLRARTSSRPPPPIGVVVSARDPLARVLGLGRDKQLAGAVVAFLIALLVHGSAVARMAAIDVELLAWTHQLRLAINDKLASTYDIDVEKPKAPEPPPPEVKEEPKEDKAPPPPAPKTSTPPPPPAAAQAGAVLTQQPDNTPVDFTNTFVTGSGETYAGGVTQASGTSTTAVYNRNAQAGGVPGGTGTKPAPPGPPVQDRSRPLSVASADWHCDFPAEADSEQVDEMVVPTEVTVSAQGRVTSAHAMKNPGFGFARAAEQCALRQGAATFNLAFDHDGNAIAGTRTFNVHFTR